MVFLASTPSGITGWCIPTTLDQDLERIYTLRDLGYWAYVMIYDKEHCPQVYKELQRWCNNRFVFGVCKSFDDYRVQKKKPKEETLSLFE